MAAVNLLLFDIDGTLIRSSGGGQSIFAALEQVLGRPFPEKTWDMGGKTDRLIFREMSERMGLVGKDFLDRVPELDRCYLKELEERLSRTEVRTHPGVESLLEALGSQNQVLALLTGNHPEGARMKLERAGIWHRFKFGAYGHQTDRREDLPALARALAREKVGREFGQKQMIIIGDTPRDIACARAGGCRVLAVATGGSSYEVLEAAKPDLLVRTLEDPRCLEFLIS